MNKICKITQCGKTTYGLGYCRLHWRRAKKHGDPLSNGNRHGMTGTSIYNRWKEIKRRTSKPSSINYKNYGGRGIKMCDTWVESFKSFYDYLGNPPTPSHTIERIDNNKGYEPGNVRWATYHEQSLNKRETSNRHNLSGVQITKNTFWSAIVINGKKKYLGSFTTAEEAHNAYITAKKEIK